MARRTIPILKRFLQSAENPPQNGLISSLNLTKSVTYMPRLGDGIGPLVTGAIEQVIEAMHAPVYFERYAIHGDMSKVPNEVIESCWFLVPDVVLRVLVKAPKKINFPTHFLKHPHLNFNLVRAHVIVKAP